MKEDFSPLLQLRVLRSGLLQDGNVGVGIFPEGEEILVRGVALCTVALKSIGTGEIEARERTKSKVENDARVINYLLKLFGGLFAVLFHEECLAAKVHRIHRSQLEWRGLAQVEW